MIKECSLTLFYPGGGALSATVFGDLLLLLNGFNYCIETSWLFLDIKKKIFTPTPLEGGTKKMKIVKIRA